jgi:iron complex transport system substrate-binding protein
VILNDYHTQSLENHVKSMKLIGDVVGRPERARELIDYYTKQCAVVDERLAKASPVRPRVYIELGANAKEYQNTYGKMMWGLLIARSGGLNIAENVVKTYGPVSPEFVLKANPQVVVFTGSYWPSRLESLQLGYFADEQDARNRLKAFLSRPGWSGLEAVQKGRVYGIHHILSREIWDFYAFQCLAKWFHPELFADVNPLDNYKEFHEKFLGVDYSGTWTVELN